MKHPDYNIAAVAGSPRLPGHFSRYTDDAPGEWPTGRALAWDRTLVSRSDRKAVTREDRM